MPAKEPAVEGERWGHQGGHVALQRVCGHAATVHRMDPGRRKPLNATNNTQYGVSAAEYADRSVEFAHVRSQILSNDAGLIVWLNEQVGREETRRRLFHHHHRIPMMHMWGSRKARPVLAQGERVAVPHALDPPRVAPLLKIDPSPPGAAGKHGLWRRPNKAPHPATFVSFEVSNNDIAE